MNEWNAYCDAVLRYVNHATYKEQIALRTELREHLEDHSEALAERGCPGEELAARTVAAMGDPETIGKALNAQFSFGWLLLSRLALGLCLVLVVLLLSPLNDMVWRVTGNLQAQYAPMAAFDGSDELEGRLWHYDPGLTAKVLDTTVRVYDVAGTEEAIYVYFSQYADNPFQVPIPFLSAATIFPTKGGGFYGPFDSRIELPIDGYAEGDGRRILREDLLTAPDYIRVEYGQEFFLTIPLEGGDAS